MTPPSERLKPEESLIAVAYSVADRYGHREGLDLLKPDRVQGVQEALKEARGVIAQVEAFVRDYRKDPDYLRRLTHGGQ